MLLIGKSRGRKSTVSTTEKIAVLRPMQKARAAKDFAVDHFPKAGFTGCGTASGRYCKTLDAQARGIPSSPRYSHSFKSFILELKCPIIEHWAKLRRP